METMRGMGCTVGDYVGDGQGEVDNTAEASSSVTADLDIADDMVDYPLDGEDSDDGDVREPDGDDREPLFIFYDCETTGLSVYKDHITDIAAKVVACPVPITSPTFSSLVKTSKHVPAVGMLTGNTLCTQYFFKIFVESNKSYRNHQHHAT